MNACEREVIILNSAWKMIDRMVNWGMFVRGDDLREPTNLMFQDRERARIFVIHLGDFLSQVRAYGNQPVPLGLKAVPAGARPSDRTFLFQLRQVCTAPRLGTDAVELSTNVEAFAQWLEDEFVASEVWLPDIDVEVDLRIARYRYLRMCGDIAKHHLGRLSANVGHIRALLKQANRDVGEQEAYLAVENFFDWFFDSIFLYHASQIAEFLNNIRWAIFDFLEREFRHSYHLTENATLDFPAYSYHVPEIITEPVARAMYWDVMNRVLQQPKFPRFVIHEIYKRCY